MKRRSFFGTVTMAFAGAKMAKAFGFTRPTPIAPIETRDEPKMEPLIHEWFVDVTITIPGGVDQVDVYMVPLSGGSREKIGSVTESGPRRLGPFARPMDDSQLYFMSIGG